MTEGAWAQSCPRTHVNQGSCSLRARCGTECGGNDYTPASHGEPRYAPEPAHVHTSDDASQICLHLVMNKVATNTAGQSERHACRRGPTSPLLPAYPKDRGRSSGSSQCRHFWLLEDISRYRQRTARDRYVTHDPSPFMPLSSAACSRLLSAPKPCAGKKESACGCAGVYSAHAALELYADVFDRAGALDKLEAFCSLNGANFYGLQPNSHRVTLERAPWQVPDTLPFGDSLVVPFGAGDTLPWRKREGQA